MTKIRVMIVEDSGVVRAFLEHLIGRDPLEVAAAVGSAEEALRALDRVAPDVISMDIRLPGMNGFDATRQIMATRPTPVVVVSASVDAEDLQISMNALRVGALSVVEKPVGTSHRDYEALADRLCTQLAIMSQVKVIRQRLTRRPAGALSGAHANPRGPFRAVGVVASTGGPAALARLLGGLPPDFPLPVVVVQHITACFLDGFVSWLDGVSPLRVKKAGEGEAPLGGVVYLPAADRHLRLAGGRLRHDADEPLGLQRPSGTLLLRSMAADLGAGALGVVLTGMGDDGAEGLGAVRAAGGYTLAEDESTCVVHGMPAAAVRLGAVCESLPLPDIAPRVLELVFAGGG